MHDASTVAFLFYPELVSFVRASVKISSADEGTRGTSLPASLMHHATRTSHGACRTGFTYYDQRHHPKLGGGCWVATSIDTAWAAVMVQDLMCEYNEEQLQTRMRHFTEIGPGTTQTSRSESGP